MNDVSKNDDHLDSTILLAIVVASSGFLLMVLGAVYYLTRLGDVPTRYAVSEKAVPPSSIATPPTPKSNPDTSMNIPSTTKPREELIEVYAPSGKLGIILEDGIGGPPMVHEIRPDSVLGDELQIGDRVIALDGENVQQMSASRVSKLISQKLEQPTRKFTIIRTVAPDA